MIFASTSKILKRMCMYTELKKKIPPEPVPMINQGHLRRKVKF